MINHIKIPKQPTPPTKAVQNNIVSDTLVSILIVYVIVSYCMLAFGNLDAEMRKLLLYYDICACVYFLFDWFVRFFQSDNRKRFAYRNSLDFIVSLPIVEVFHYIGFLKIMQFMRIFRLMKLFTSLDRIRGISKVNRAQLLKVVGSVIFVVLMIISPILMLMVERPAGGNIDSASDAIWWTYCTISTIGYGDLYPITGIGRLIAIGVSIGGIALFGMVSALLVNFVLTHMRK